MGAGGAVPLVVVDDFIAADEWRGHFKSNLKSGEMRLMLELLIDAIRLYLGDVGRLKRKQWPEAEAWIGEDNDLLFGFANVCECLGIDKNYLRAGLRKARKEPGRHHIARAPRGCTARTGISASPYASGAKRNAQSIGYY